LLKILNRRFLATKLKAFSHNPGPQKKNLIMLGTHAISHFMLFDQI